MGIGPRPIVDWLTVLLAVLAAVLLIRFRINSAWLVLGGGLVALAYRVFGG
jgi:chromate transporter